MKAIKNIICVVIVGIAVIVSCVGSYHAHNYSISLKPSSTYEEVVELPEVTEEIVETVPEVIEEDTEMIEELIYDDDFVQQVKSDIQVIAEVVASEASNQPLVGKVGVAATLINRMEATGRSAESIALEAYAYPYHGTVTNECYRAVEIAMENRDLFPSDMFYFRTGHYHTFGVPYCQIGDHYFSTKE